MFTPQMFTLTITSSDGPLWPVALTATIEKKEGRLQVTEASIHQITPGKTSDIGIDAFRCLCLAETIITLATGLKSPDPQAEIDALKKNVTALQTQLKGLEP